MVVQAYILIQTDVGKAAEVAKAIAQVKGVTMAEDVTGPYDVIVRAEARNVDELGKLVVARVQTLDGITRTLTCPVVHIYGPPDLRTPRRPVPTGPGASLCRRPAVSTATCRHLVTGSRGTARVRVSAARCRGPGPAGRAGRPAAGSRGRWP